MATSTRKSDPTAHSMLNEVQALNTIAADLIGMDDHREAIEVLTYAVSQLSWCLLAPTPLKTTINSQTGLETTTRQRHGVSVYTANLSTKDPSATNGDFYFHPCIFEWSPDEDQDEGTLTNEQYCFCAISCLYNLGLCYHIEWTKQKCDTQLLMNAKQCYDQAFALTSNCTVCPNDTILPVLMAVCHNSSHCHGELADYRQYDHWNKKLRQVLEFSIESEGNRSFFLFNAFFNSFSRVSAPAA